jgi:hypothetical protein
MEGWRWRVVLAVIGLTLLICSACLVTTSRLHIEWRKDRDIVPIEAPPVDPTPRSQRGTFSAHLLHLLLGGG